jgi:hypothetical protein
MRPDERRWLIVGLLAGVESGVATVALVMSPSAASAVAAGSGGIVAALVTLTRISAQEARRSPGFRQAVGPSARVRGSTLLEAFLHVGAGLLPAGARPRYREEWDAERAELRSRWARVRFTAPLLLVAIPRLAWALRVGSRRREPR